MTEDSVKEISTDSAFQQKCMLKAIRLLEKSYATQSMTDGERAVYTAYLAQQKIDRLGRIALGSAAATAMFINSRLTYGNIFKLASYAAILIGSYSLYQQIQETSIRKLFQLAVIQPIRQKWPGNFLTINDLKAIEKAQLLRRLNTAEEAMLQKKYRFDPQSYH